MNTNQKRETEMTINTALIDDIINIITTEPEAFNMDTWGREDDVVENECGTTCCLAGWARVLAAKPGVGRKRAVNNLIKDPDATARIARRALGLPPLTVAQQQLTFGDHLDMVPLFFDAQWPDHYRCDVDHDDEVGTAAVAAQLLADMKDGTVQYDGSMFADNQWWEQFTKNVPVGA